MQLFVTMSIYNRIERTISWSVAMIRYGDLLETIVVHLCICKSLSSFFFQYFQELQRNVIAMQPLEKQEDMAQCFRNLMEGVEPSLITKNRDR